MATEQPVLKQEQYKEVRPAKSKRAKRTKQDRNTYEDDDYYG